jgi:hypothetical protein
MRNQVIVVLAALLAGPIATAKGPPREDLWKDVSEQRNKLQIAEEQLLAPDSQDVEAFASLLAQPDTGLARLLPRERGEKALAIRGGGAYYSFSRRTHEYGFGSDIELSNGTLSSGFAGANFGFFEEAGEIPLEVITPEHPAASTLAAFETPATLAGARKVQSALRDAAGAGPRGLIRQVGVSVGRSYVLRSVDYGFSDVLAAFRVVRQDEDGSITLLWKILRRFPTPNLKD